MIRMFRCPSSGNSLRIVVKSLLLSGTLEVPLLLQIISYNYPHLVTRTTGLCNIVPHSCIANIAQFQQPREG